MIFGWYGIGWLIDMSMDGIHTGICTPSRHEGIYAHISLYILWKLYRVLLGECMGCKQHCVDVFTCEWDEWMCMIHTRVQYKSM